MSECPELELISAYVDNELTNEEWVNVEAHLRDCRACRESLRDLRDAKALIASAPTVHAPADLTASLLSQLSERLDQPPARRPIPWWAGGVAAAAAGLSIWIGLHEWTPRGIALESLVAAHYHQPADNVHDAVRSAAVYSEFLKRSESRGRS